MNPQSKRQIIRQIQHVVRHPYFSQMIVGVVGCLAFLMLVSFFALSWVGNEDGSISGMGIWTGGNEDVPSLKLQEVEVPGSKVAALAESGVSNVRFIDRLLIVVPLGAITLMVLAGMVILNHLPAGQGLGSIAAIAFLLIMFPYLWKGLSTANWRNFLEGHDLTGVDDYMETLTDFYSTGEYTLFGLLILLVSVIGLGLFLAERYGVLDRFAASGDKG